MHEIHLLTTLAGAFSAALVLGSLAARLGLSPIPGYLLAGIVVGPFTPGFVADPRLASELAEVGVILLMFGVGMHFHGGDLLAVRGIAIPGALGQVLTATVLGAAVSMAFGWSLAHALVLGAAVSVASTVVLMRVLTDHHAVDTPHGHVAVGWLIVEDLITVAVLVLLPALAVDRSGGGAGGLVAAMGLALVKMVGLGVVMGFGGRRVIPWVLLQAARLRSRELFTLAVLALALAIAVGSAHLFGVSMALGAFLAGMVVAQSPLSHQAAADALPMRDAFAVLFFVSVGMLFDPGLLVQQPGLIVAVLAIVLVVKPLAALVLVACLGYSARTALTVAIGLGQIGEFSFILGDLARRLDLLPPSGVGILVATAVVSISVNPLLFRCIDPLLAWCQRHPWLWALMNRRAQARGKALAPASAAAGDGKSARVRAIVVGYGPVGRTVTRILGRFDIEAVVVELNTDTLAELSQAGVPAIYGDAASRDVLVAAGAGRARYLIVTLPDASAGTAVLRAARAVNPELRILFRARYLSDREALASLGVDAACFEEAEAAVGLAAMVVREVGAPAEQVAEEAARIRADLALHTAARAPLPPRSARDGRIVDCSRLGLMGAFAMHSPAPGALGPRPTVA